MARAYAKARNNDPALPFNSREKEFRSGRGFAVDIRVRDYNGAAAARYAEGVIIGFWEFESDARRVAEEVNRGDRYPRGHHLHGRAHSAIVVPAWNGSDDLDDVKPWETAEGSAEMVAAYERSGEPLPRWLQEIRAGLGLGVVNEVDPPGLAAEDGDDDGSEPSGGSASQVRFDDDFLELLLGAVRVGETITTLGTGRPNRIASVYRDGVRVHTEKSERKGSGPQLVPAWMIVVAWNHLREHGELSQRELLDGLNVKRSAFVCALLAHFPDVEFDSVPHVRLRLAQKTDTPVRYGDGGRARADVVDTASEWAGASTYADRLKYQLSTFRRDSGGPFSPEQVAESLQDEGILLHVNSIHRLLQGIGGRPDDRISHALAYFFEVDPDYFTADEGPQDDVQIQRPQPPAHVAAKPDPTTDEATIPGGPLDEDVDLSVAQLIRLVAGISGAAKYFIRSPRSGEELMHRLVFLTLESGPLLAQAVVANVLVSRRFLERLRAAWEEAGPDESGTSDDYSFLVEILTEPHDQRG